MRRNSHAHFDATLDAAIGDKNERIATLAAATRALVGVSKKNTQPSLASVAIVERKGKVKHGHGKSQEQPSLASEMLQRRVAAKALVIKKSEAETHAMHNQSHIAYLERRLKQALPHVVQSEQEDNWQFNKSKVSLRRINRETGLMKDMSTCGFAGIMKCSNGEDSKVITHAEICMAIADDNNGALLGYELGGLPSAHAESLIVWSDKEGKTLRYVIANLRPLLRDVPFDGGGFLLMPEQRLWIAMYNMKVDSDVTCKVKKAGTVMEPIEMTRPANTSSDFAINNMPVGSGKTCTMLISILMTIVTDRAWERTQSEWKLVNDRGRSVNNLGLMRKRPCRERHLARVVVVMVPESLLDQWIEHAKNLRPVFKQSEKKFHVWHGLKVKTRKSTTTDKVERNMQTAYDLTERTGLALLWIMAADTKANQAATRSAPNIAYVARLYDEVLGTRNTEPRQPGLDSEVMKNIMINATVPMLKDATDTQATHPLRRALGGEKMDMQSPDHMAIMHHCTAPHWMRQMLSEGMGPLFPSGVSLMNLYIKKQSLAAIVHGTSDMVITTLDDLLMHMISALDRTVTFPESEVKAMKSKAKDILTRAGRFKGNTNISETLKESARLAQENMDAMPEINTGSVYVRSLAAAELCEHNTKVMQRKCYGGMVRLYETLQTAVDPTPNETRYCPILYEETAPEDVVFMTCCTQWMCRRALGGLLAQKCPFCNDPIGNHAVDDESIADVLQQHLNNDNQPDPEPEVEPEPELVVEGDNSAFQSRLIAMKQTKFKAGPEAAIQAIKHALAWKSKGLRILLTFHYVLDGSAGSLINKVRDWVMKENPGLTSLEPVLDNASSSAVQDYQRVDDTNRILIINTTRGSNSLAGLNLGGTDVVIFDRTASASNGSDILSPSQIVQAIGRALRPQAQKKLPPGQVAINPYSTQTRPGKRPLENDEGITTVPQSPHAAKIVIFLDAA